MSPLVRLAADEASRDKGACGYGLELELEEPDSVGGINEDELGRSVSFPFSLSFSFPFPFLFTPSPSVNLRCSISMASVMVRSEA
jgi:hypothetical protein